MILTADQARRFWAKVNLTDTCWLWTRATQSGGYGSFGIGNKRTETAHRISYLTLVGPVPAGLELDHLCLNKLCVRPDHLEAVTPQVNNQRAHDNGQAQPSPLSRINAAKIACPAGHFYSDDNTYVNPQGHRQCRTCKRASDNRRNARLRDKIEDAA